MTIPLKTSRRLACGLAIASGIAACGSSASTDVVKPGPACDKLPAAQVASAMNWNPAQISGELDRSTVEKNGYTTCRFYDETSNATVSARLEWTKPQHAGKGYVAKRFANDLAGSEGWKAVDGPGTKTLMRTGQTSFGQTMHTVRTRYDSAFWMQIEFMNAGIDADAAHARSLQLMNAVLD